MLTVRSDLFYFDPAGPRADPPAAAREGGGFERVFDEAALPRGAETGVLPAPEDVRVDPANALAKTDDEPVAEEPGKQPALPETQATSHPDEVATAPFQVHAGPAEDAAARRATDAPAPVSMNPQNLTGSVPPEPRTGSAPGHMMASGPVERAIPAQGLAPDRRPAGDLFPLQNTTPLAKTEQDGAIAAHGSPRPGAAAARDVEMNVVPSFPARTGRTLHKPTLRSELLVEAATLRPRETLDAAGPSAPMNGTTARDRVGQSIPILRTVFTSPLTPSQQLSGPGTGGVQPGTSAASATLREHPHQPDRTEGEIFRARMTSREAIAAPGGHAFTPDRAQAPFTSATGLRPDARATPRTEQGRTVIQPTGKTVEPKVLPVSPSPVPAGPEAPIADGTVFHGDGPESAIGIERSGSAQPAPATPTVATPGAAAPLSPHTLRQVAEAVQHLPNRPVEITLSPEELGRVRLSVSAQDAGLSLTVLAERPETLDLLRRNIDQLQREFQQLGYEDVTFSFSGQEHGDASDGSAESEDKTSTPHTARSGEADRVGPPPVVLMLGSDGALDIRL
jgi:flagellar hook-length control protein FliK